MSGLYSRLVFLALVLCIASAAAVAQPVPGDVIFGKIDTTSPGRGLYWVDSTGKLGTILATSGGDFPNALSMADDNLSFLVCMSGTQDRLVRVGVNGSTTLYAALPVGSPNGLARDQDGTWLVTTSDTNALLRFDPVARTVATIYNHGPESGGIVNSVAVDGRTQEYLLGLYGDGVSPVPRGVIRVNRTGTAATTLASGAPWNNISSLAWDLDTGKVAVTKFSAPEFVRLESGGGLTTIAGPTYANASTLARDKSFWVAGNGFLRRIDSRNGATVKTHTFTGFLPTCVAVYGDRQLHTTGSSATGQTLTFHLQSARPQDAGKGFVLAFSMAGSHPGIPLPDGRVIRMAYDTFLPANIIGLLSAFWNGGTNIGILDGKGQGTARFTIPTFLPKTAKFQFFAVFVTLDSAAPSGIGTVSNAVPFTTNL